MLPSGPSWSQGDSWQCSPHPPFQNLKTLSVTLPIVCDPSCFESKGQRPKRQSEVNSEEQCVTVKPETQVSEVNSQVSEVNSEVSEINSKEQRVTVTTESKVY